MGALFVDDFFKEFSHKREDKCRMIASREAKVKREFFEDGETWACLEAVGK